MRVLLLLALLLAACATAAAQGNSTSTPFVPRDDILLDYDAKGQGKDTDGRVWTGDAGSKYAPPDNLTARVSASPFTYSFPLGPGRKFLRLHFYPANYSNRDATDGLFSVSAANPGGKLTPLSNFSAYQTAVAITYSYLMCRVTWKVKASIRRGLCRMKAKCETNRASRQRVVAKGYEADRNRAGAD